MDQLLWQYQAFEDSVPFCGSYDCRGNHCLSRNRLATVIYLVGCSHMKLCVVQAIFAALLILSGCYSGSRPNGIGRAAPNFTVQDSENTISLNQFRRQVVVLNFWASWCAPCIAETPSLVNMQRRLQAKGVVVLAISADKDEAAYHRFVKDYGISFVTVRDPTERIQHLYGTIQIPETYVIDRQGVLRRKFANSVDWTSPEVLEFLDGL